MKTPGSQPPPTRPRPRNTGRNGGTRQPHHSPRPHGRAVPNPAPDGVRNSDGQPRKKRRWRAFFYILFWLIITGMFSGAILMQASSYNHYRRELNYALEELEYERKIHESLLDQMAFYESDMYIEQLAREQLGFVRPDEIVFVNIAD